jgi:hypothetical protein
MDKYYWYLLVGERRAGFHLSGNPPLDFNRPKNFLPILARRLKLAGI